MLKNGPIWFLVQIAWDLGPVSSGTCPAVSVKSLELSTSLVLTVPKPIDSGTCTATASFRKDPAPAVRLASHFRKTEKILSSFSSGVFFFIREGGTSSLEAAAFCS